MTERDNTSPHIQAFLIADLRGYTRYTQEQGDEAAAQVASRLEATARELEHEFGGRVVEARGDEVLVVFSSSRQALRAAVELQTRLASDPMNPLPAGIGVDAGESVPLGEGFRGAALNVAARLCSIAAPGEILTTEVVAHLAGKLEGIVYVDQGAQQLKGLEGQVRAVAVHREGGELMPATKLPVQRNPALPARIPFEELSEDLTHTVSEQIRFAVLSKLAQSEQHVARRHPVPGLPVPPRSSASREEVAIAVAALAAGCIIVIAIIIGIVVIIH